MIAIVMSLSCRYAGEALPAYRGWLHRLRSEGKLSEDKRWQRNLEWLHLLDL